MDQLEFLDKKTLSLIISALRKSFAYNSPEYTAALDKVVDQSGPKGGRRWKCEGCGGKSARKDIFIDHIEPLVPLNTNVSNLSFKQLYERCWTNRNNLQVLCYTCHRVKSAKENSIRKEFRKLSKPEVIKIKKSKKKG
jgi:hypothetical protein